MNFGPYPAIITSIHDGDTLTVDLDLGFGVHLRDLSARFFGINAPELRTQAGKEALVYLQTLVKVGDPLTVTSHGWDKYGGRFDATLVTAAGLDLSLAMLSSGHAVKM